MIKKTILITIIILLGLFSCKQSNSKVKNNETKFSSSLDSIIYNNYITAIDNGGTFQYFLVVKVKDLNTGNVREICTKGNFLSGALHHEYNLDYNEKDGTKLHKLLLENKERYFELKDTSAINNLGINQYSIKDLQKFEKENNIDSIAKSIKNNKWAMSFSDDKTMLLFAHSLFNRGVLTGENSCFGGNLLHIDKQILDERNQRIKEVKKMSTKK